MIGAPFVVLLRRFMGKNAAALFTLSTLVGIFCLLIYLFVPPLVNQINNLSKIDYRNAINSLEEPIRDWENWLVNKKMMINENDEVVNPNEDNTFAENIESRYPALILDTLHIMNDSTLSVTNINISLQLPSTEPIEPVTYSKDNGENSFFNQLKRTSSNFLNPERIKSIFRSSVQSLGDVIIALFAIFFISFFFLKEQGLFDKILTSVVPTRYEKHTTQALDETSKLLIRYFIGILVQVSIVSFTVSVSLKLIGVDNALLIGFFAGLMNVIPYIGPIIGASFGAMIVLSSNVEQLFYVHTLPLLSQTLIVFLVVQILDNVILQPLIFSKSVKAHPLEIFIIVLVGAKAAGILGMVLAIPFYTAFRVVAKVFLSEFKVIQNLTKNL